MGQSGCYAHLAFKNLSFAKRRLLQAKSTWNGRFSSSERTNWSECLNQWPGINAALAKDDYHPFTAPKCRPDCCHSNFAEPHEGDFRSVRLSNSICQSCKRRKLRRNTDKAYAFNTLVWPKGNSRLPIREILRRFCAYGDIEVTRVWRCTIRHTTQDRDDLAPCQADA